MCLYLIFQTDKVLLFSEPLIWDKSNKRREFVQEKQIPRGKFQTGLQNSLPHRTAGRPRAGQGLGQQGSVCPFLGECTGSDRGDPSKHTLRGSSVLAVVLHFLPRHTAIVLLTCIPGKASRKPWHCGG